MRAGNCTDFHSLFIGEARSLGISARFTIGFSVPNDKPAGDVAGYHCWAEFWDDQQGWLPIDASEAAKDKTRRDALFGGLDADRVDFVWGRDIK
ncbi:MAG: transglutaminase domain-containing protein, partial [bacterium]|nr:transglutaminase domain-containing protein [bacterium]